MFDIGDTSVIMSHVNLCEDTVGSRARALTRIRSFELSRITKIGILELDLMKYFVIAM